MNESTRHLRPSRGKSALSFVAAVIAVGGGGGCALGEGAVEDLGSTGNEVAAPPLPEKEFPEQIDPGFEGRWVGYVENPFERDELGQPTRVVFASGSSEVTLDYRFNECPDGDPDDCPAPPVVPRPSATLVFGAGPAEAPQPGVAYPAGVNHYSAWAGFSGRSLFETPVVEGFDYRLAEGPPRFAGYDPGRVSLLLFDQRSPFVEWCAVQEPRQQSDGHYDCIGADGFSGGNPLQNEACVVTRADRAMEEVDCNFAALCLSDLCSCDAGGCTATYDPRPVSVFLERRGDEIVGTISGATLESSYPGWHQPMGTLRLSRL